MVRHADTEVTVMKEEVYTHSSLKVGIAHHTGLCGEAPGMVKSQEESGNHLYCGFCREVKGRH